MKKLISIIAILLLATTAHAGFFSNLLGGGTGTINQLSQWRATSTPYSAITTNVHGKNLYMPYGVATTSELWLIGQAGVGCAEFDANGKLTNTSSACGSGGGGGTFAWTPQTWGNSTSTTIGFLNGLLSTASSTFSSITFFDGLSTFSSGLIADNATTTNATSTTNYTDTLGVNSEYFTDLTGTGLLNTGGALTLDNTGAWDGTYTNFGSDFYTYFSATNTDALSEGSTNWYATQSHWDSFWNASTTLDSVTTLLNLTDLIATNATTTNATTTNIHISGTGSFFDKNSDLFTMLDLSSHQLDAYNELATTEFDTTAGTTGGVRTITLTQPESENLEFIIGETRLEHTGITMTNTMEDKAGTDANPNAVYTYVENSAGSPNATSTNTDPSSAISHVDGVYEMVGGISGSTANIYATRNTRPYLHEKTEKILDRFADEGMLYKSGIIITASSTGFTTTSGTVLQAVDKVTIPALYLNSTSVVDNQFTIEDDDTYVTYNDFQFDEYYDGTVFGSGECALTRIGAVVNNPEGTSARYHLIPQDGSNTYDGAKKAWEDKKNMAVIIPRESIVAEAFVAIADIVICNNAGVYTLGVHPDTGLYYRDVKVGGLTGSSGGGGSVLQNIWETIAGDTGSEITTSPTATLNITGAGNNLTTDMIGTTLTITDSLTPTFTSLISGTATTTSATTTDFYVSGNINSATNYYINGTEVINSNTLGSGITSSSLTTLGTIDTGVWNGTAIDISDYTNLTVTYPVTLTGDTIGLAFGTTTANIWTDSLQTFGYASSTGWSSDYASSTLGYFGTLNLPGLATGAGTFVAIDPNGNMIATTTPAGGGSGDITAVWGCTTGDCSDLTASAGDKLDAGGADSIEMVNSANPTLDTIGEFGLDTTDNTFNMYANGAERVFASATTTVQLSPILSDNDWDNENVIVFQAPPDSAITLVECRVSANGTTPSLGFYLKEYAWGATTSPATLYGQGTTTDSGLIIQSFTDASVAANARVTISTTTGAEGGTVDRVTGTCSYYKDVE